MLLEASCVIFSGSVTRNLGPRSGVLVIKALELTVPPWQMWHTAGILPMVSIVVRFGVLGFLNPLTLNPIDPNPKP